MASTVGHTICGIACYVVARRLNPEIAAFPLAKGALLFIFLANLPDSDLLFGYLFASNPLQYHWGITHTLFFSMLVGVLIGYVMRMARPSSPFSGGLLALIISSHIVMDLLTGPQWGLHESYGLKIFSPFFDVSMTSPLSLFLGVRHELNYFISSQNLLAVAIEVLVFLPAIVGLMITARSNDCGINGVKRK